MERRGGTAQKITLKRAGTKENIWKNKGEKGRQRNKRDNEKYKSNENFVTREGKESYEYFNI